MQRIFEDSYLSGLAYETPFFLFSKKVLVETHARFQKAFPKALVAYAIKANPEEHVLQTFAEAGASFEVASVYELDMIKAFGVKADRIIYGTSVKPAAHIRVFADYGVDRFAFDSMGELEKIAAAAPGARVYARAIVSDAGSVFKLSEKFGAEVPAIPSLLSRARDLGLVPWGISFHVGSQALNPLAWAEAIESIAPVVHQLHEQGIKIEVLNIGGGFPHPYPSSIEIVNIEEIAGSVHAALKKLPHALQIIAEPGRALVAGAAVLVVSVIAKVERSGKQWLFLDAGAYNALFETMAFQGSTRYPVTLLRPSYNAGEAEFTLTGPTGDSIDTITKEARLPADVDVGDKLVFHDVGAYSSCLASFFNGFPKPSIYIA